jgi:hypothetical protein
MLDGGTLLRWGDPAFREVYHSIWSGNPLDHDPYNLKLRKETRSSNNPDCPSRVTRAFNGWTALTEAGEGEGSLMLYPNVKLAMAYALLRPFFNPPKNAAHIMDANKWSINTKKDWFPKSYRELPQILSPAVHPHLKLESCMISIPRLNPGDTVWWHPDVCFPSDDRKNMILTNSR